MFIMFEVKLNQFSIVMLLCLALRFRARALSVTGAPTGNIFFVLFSHMMLPCVVRIFFCIAENRKVSHDFENCRFFIG